MGDTENQSAESMLNFDELREMYKDAVQRGCPHDIAADYVAEAAQVMALVAEDATIDADAHRQFVEDAVSSRLRG